MKYYIKLRILRIESEIVFRSHQFFYGVCERLSKKHHEIVDRAYKIIAEEEKNG